MSLPNVPFCDRDCGSSRRRNRQANNPAFVVARPADLIAKFFQLGPEDSFVIGQLNPDPSEYIFWMASLDGFAKHQLRSQLRAG